MTDTPALSHTGSSHCDRVVFQVQGDIDSALACNGAICSCKGSLLWVVPRARVEPKSPANAATTNLFNQHLIRHRFCPVCGIHPCGENTAPRGNTMAAINLRCIEGIARSENPVHTLGSKCL